MEHMEIEQIVDVPDTPDRLTARHDDRKYVGNPEVADVMYINEKKERIFPVSDTTKNTRLAFRPLKNSCNNYITVSPSEKSYPSQNTPIFRRAQTDKNFGHGTTHCDGAEIMEKGKGKTVSTNFPSKSSQHGPISVLDLTEENGWSQQMKSAFSHRGSKHNAIEDNKELKASIGNSPLPFLADSSNTSSNTFAGQCKIDNKTLPGPNISVDRGKSIAQYNDSHSQLKIEKQVPLPPRLSTAPRARGQKRLVRNGCISPHNIATKAKQSAEQNSHQTNDVEQSHAGHSVSSNTISLISVDDIVAEERGSGRVKGKEVLIHPSSGGPNAGTIHTANSSPVINYEEANVTNNAIRNSLKYSGGQSGWRIAHNCKNTDQHLYDSNGHHLRRSDDVGRFTSRQYTNRMVRRDTGSGQSSKDVHGSLLDHAAQTTSLIIPEVGQSIGTCPTMDTLNKRQRKRGLTSGNTNEASYNSEIRFLSSSGESSISSSSTSHGFDVELLDLSSKCTNRASQDLDDMNNNNSEARARQVEADEILARELQEQLYHEDSFEGGEIDEHLAWELQHEEDLLHASIDNHHVSHPTWLPRAPSNRQPRSRSHQNPSNRRALPRVPSSNRMSQLRNRILSQSPTPNISSRRRRPRFPLDMDLDMRLDILEALENAVGDLSDMGVADDIFHAQRDFNEDDYEMLLALDEGNHQHTGASANLINSLPQSTIQTDNFTEACAICLETPVKGQIIRHLPCLHKFHKDCIDPWLHRKTSCPVCKSSIT